MEHFCLKSLTQILLGHSLLRSTDRGCGGKEGGRELDRRNDGVEGRNPEHERGGWVSNVGGMRRGWISAGRAVGATDDGTDRVAIIFAPPRPRIRADGRRGASHLRQTT